LTGNRFDDISTTMKIVCALLFLGITYPIGLLIAWFSWSLLGWMEKWFETFHYRSNNFLNRGSKNYFCFSALKEYYGLDKDNYYDVTKKIEADLEVNNYEIIEKLEDLKH